VFQRFGLPGAAVAIAIAVPLIVIAASGESGAPAPKPEETALTVRLAGAEGGDEDAFIRLTAVGNPPEQGKLYGLRDTEGLHTASVSSVDPSQQGCVDEDLRATGLEGNGNEAEWCLKLSGVDAGRELAGSVPGPSTTVALTVTRRHSFWFWPLAALLAGLLVGVLSPFASKRFVSRIRSNQLRDLLSDHDSQTTPATRRIVGLRKWAETLQATGLQTSEVAPVVNTIAKDGPRKAARFREELTNALAESELPAYLPFRQRARTEAESTTNDVAHFADATGKPVPHPAATWRAAVIAVDEASNQLKCERAAIERLPSGLRREPLERLGEACSTYWALTSSDTTRLAARLAAVRTAVENAQARADLASLAEEVAEPFESFELRFVQEPDEGQAGLLPVSTPPEHVSHEEPAALGVGPFRLDSTKLKAATFAIVGLILLIGGLTLYQTVYKPNQTFATFWDYFAFVTAAAASGAIGSALGVLAWWQLDSAEAVSA
jgi:hypothetical protein